MHAPTHIKEIVLDIDGHSICTKGALKYLGVWMERGGRCRRHIEDMSAKAARRTHALARLLDTGGPVMEKARRLYASVILSSILYAVPAWYGLIRTKKEHARLVTSSRLVTLRIIAAAPTVSTPAAEVISSQPPIDLRMAEICAVSGVRHETRPDEQQWRNGS